MSDAGPKAPVDVAWDRHATARMNVLYYEAEVGRLERSRRWLALGFAACAVASVAALALDDGAELSAVAAVLTALLAFLHPVLAPSPHALSEAVGREVVGIVGHGVRPRWFSPAS